MSMSMSMSMLRAAPLLLSLAASGATTTNEMPTPTSDEAPQTTGLCEDGHSDCKRWAASGECANNPSFMHAQCRRTCGLCPASAAGDAEERWQTRLLERWQALTLLLEGWRSGLTPPQRRLLSAFTAAVVALVSAVLWVWLQRREQQSTATTAVGAAVGLGGEDLANLREQRLSMIHRSHSKPSAALEAPLPAERPLVSPPAERPPGAPPASLRERWCAGLATRMQRLPPGGGGGGGGGGGSEGVRDSWLAHQQAQRAEAEAEAGGVAAAAAHWSTLFLSAEESEAAIEAFAAGGQALLVAVEGSDPASLHLLRSVWPDAALGRRLQGAISQGGDGGAVLALRVSTRAPQA